MKISRNSFAERNIQERLRDIANDSGIKAHNRVNTIYPEIKAFRDQIPWHKEHFWGVLLIVFILGGIFGSFIGG